MRRDLTHNLERWEGMHWNAWERVCTENTRGGMTPPTPTSAYIAFDFLFVRLRGPPPAVCCVSLSFCALPCVRCCLFVFVRVRLCAPDKCVKTVLSLCQLTPPPTRVTCIIWPWSQYLAVWLTSCDEHHTAWLTSYDLTHNSHAVCPLSRTTVWLTSCDEHHLCDLHHVIPITIVTYPTWSKSQRWPRSLK